MVDHGIVQRHVISSNGIEVDKAKIDIVHGLPFPTMVIKVRSFLGHASFCRRFNKDFSKIVRPLYIVLQKDTSFIFDEKWKETFEKLKEIFPTAPIIQAHDWNHPFELMYKASDYTNIVQGQWIEK